MKRMIAVALLALAGCVEAPPAAPQGRALTEAERADCTMRGGTVGRGGLVPDELCIRPTRDAGRACTDSDQCETFCLAETRSCAPATPYFGCFATLENGDETPMLCVD